MKHLILLALSVLITLAAACTPIAPPPDPLEPYLPAFRRESLPADFDPTIYPHYELLLRVDPEAMQIDGKAIIHYRNNGARPLNDIYVRMYPNLPQLKGVMRLTNIVTLPERFATGLGLLLDDTAAHISLTAPLPASETIDLEISYVVEMPKRDGYVLFGENNGIISLPYAYPMLAAQSNNAANPWRLEIPPLHGDVAITDLAFYSATVTTPSTYTFIATGTETATKDSDDNPGWTAHQVVTGPVREWSMILSNEFEVISQEVDGTIINNYYLPDDKISGQAALKQAAASLRIYNRIFAPYPYTELDIVQAPTRFLGMEYPGLNLIGLDTYREQDRSQELLVAHEVSHQWWYALVGSEPYGYPWLDEGLAEHSSLLYMEQLYGKAAANQVRATWELSAEWAAKNGYDDIVGQEVTAFDGINYEILVYGKSALFFDSLYQELGRELYLKVLQEYIRRYSFKTPTPQDFLDVVKEVSSFDPDPLFQKWIMSKQ